MSRVGIINDKGFYDRTTAMIIQYSEQLQLHIVYILFWWIHLLNCKYCIVIFEVHNNIHMIDSEFIVSSYIIYIQDNKNGKE